MSAEPGTPRQSVWCPIRDADGSVCNRPAGHTAPCRFVEPYPAPSTGGEDYQCATCGFDAIGHDEPEFPCKWTEADVLRQHLRDSAGSGTARFPRRATPDRAPGLREAEVTRFEVIDRRILGKGRAFVAHDIAVELSYQDDGRTLKVFVTDRTPEAP